MVSIVFGAAAGRIADLMQKNREYLKAKQGMLEEYMLRKNYKYVVGRDKYVPMNLFRVKNLELVSLNFNYLFQNLVHRGGVYLVSMLVIIKHACGNIKKRG